MLIIITPAQIIWGKPCIVDDLGNRIVLQHPAQRVISLYSSFNEILQAMELGNIIIAKTKYEPFPNIPSIGTHMRPNFERIVGLSPDLVLQMGGRSEAIQSLAPLKRFGITTAFFQIHNFDDLFSVITRLGILTAQEQKAHRLIENMRQRLNTISKAIQQSTVSPTVFFEVRSPNLLTVGQHSMVSEIIQKAGGTNCILNEKKLVRTTEEEILKHNPNVYIMQRGPMNNNPIRLKSRPRLKALACAQNHAEYIVEEADFSKPGPHNIKAVEFLAKILHPECFDAAQGESQP